MKARDTTKVYIWRLDTGCGPTLYRKCHSHNTPGKRHNNTWVEPLAGNCTTSSTRQREQVWHKCKIQKNWCSHCGTNNRAPWWTFTDPCKQEVTPGAREGSASPAWLAAPAMNARDTTKLYMNKWYEIPTSFYKTFNSWNLVQPTSKHLHYPRSRRYKNCNLCVFNSIDSEDKIAGGVLESHSSQNELRKENPMTNWFGCSFVFGICMI